MSSLNNEKVGVLCIFKRTYIFWLVLGSKKKQILAISTYDLKTCNWIKRILQGEYKQKKKNGLVDIRKMEVFLSYRKMMQYKTWKQFILTEL